MGTKVPGYPPTLPTSAPVTTTVTWDTLTGKPATFPPATHTHAYADITGKPATFPPATHTHVYADITGKPTTFAPSAHTHLWAEIADKPATFPPSTHTHSYNDLTDKPVIPPTTGRLVLVGTAAIGETLLLSLALGVKRYTGTMVGLAVGDRIIAFLTGAPGASSLQDIYVSATNTYNVGLLNPALGIGSVIAVPIAIYKVTT